MKLGLAFFTALFILSSSVLDAQKKTICLDDIWHDGTFRQEQLDALRSMNNGEEYTIVNVHQKERSISLDAYSYASGEKTRTVLNTADIPGLDYFQTYDFNADESEVLLSTDMESIYRRSTQGIYFVYDLNDKTLQKVSDHKIKEPTFSPNGKQVAYVYKNNIYIKDLQSDQLTQVTKDGKTNAIINGTTDWVYEEEFAFTRAYEWNKDGSKIAYLRFDESEVPEITMEFYGTYPHQLYPEPYTYKYPKAGEKNSDVSLHLYDLKSKKSTKVDLKKDYEYLPRI